MKITGIAREDLQAKGLILDNEITLTLKDGYGIPDIYGQIIGREYLSTGKRKSYFETDHENDNINEFVKFLENVNLMRKQRCVYDETTNQDMNVIDYFVPYDIKESTKNIPTYTEDYIGTDYVMNGSYKAKYEVLLTAGENSTRRLVIEHDAVNVPMVDIISDIEDMVDEAFRNEADSDNPFINAFVCCDEDDDFYEEYREIIMYDEVGQIVNIEVDSVSQVMAMIVSIRQIGCEFIRK